MCKPSLKPFKVLGTRQQCQGTTAVPEVAAVLGYANQSEILTSVGRHGFVRREWTFSDVAVLCPFADWLTCRLRAHPKLSITCVTAMREP